MQTEKGALERVTRRIISKGHGEAGPRDTYIVQLVVEPAGVADRVPVGIPSPESGSGGLTVSTGRSCSSCCRLGSGERERVGESKQMLNVFSELQRQILKNKKKEIIIEIKTSKWPT